MAAGRGETSPRSSSPHALLHNCVPSLFMLALQRCSFLPVRPVSTEFDQLSPEESISDRDPQRYSDSTAPSSHETSSVGARRMWRYGRMNTLRTST